MRRWMLSGIGLLGLAAALWFAPEASRRRGGAAEQERARSSSRAPAAARPDIDIDAGYPGKPFDTQKLMARRLLRLSPEALREKIGGMDAPVAMAFSIAVGSLAEDDIKKSGDTALLEFLIANPWIMSHAGSFEVLSGVKSPAGPEADFAMKNRLLDMLLEADPETDRASWRRHIMLQSFGATHGADAAKAGWLPPVEGADLLSYVRGCVAGTAKREQIMATLSLAEGGKEHEKAVGIAIPLLLGADAMATSRMLAALPPSRTKDLAVSEMVGWLAKMGSRDECGPWLETIADPVIRARTAEGISTPSP